MQRGDGAPGVAKKTRNMIQLSLLICHYPAQSWRLEPFARLMANLAEQTRGIEDAVEIIVDDRLDPSIGAKRNNLLQAADGIYVAFIDDDDQVSSNYILRLLQGMSEGVDCCSLRGIITDDGKNPRIFEHSLRHDHWFEENGRYYRNTNHLNCVRASIAKQISFPEEGKIANQGEDHEWSKKLLASGLLKTEFWIEDVIYFYNHISNK